MRECAIPLDGRVVVVTGASSGQGAAEARRVYQDGAAVVVTDGSVAPRAPETPSSSTRPSPPSRPASPRTQTASRPAPRAPRASSGTPHRRHVTVRQRAADLERLLDVDQHADAFAVRSPGRGAGGVAPTAPTANSSIEKRRTAQARTYLTPFGTPWARHQVAELGTEPREVNGGTRSVAVGNLAPPLRPRLGTASRPRAASPARSTHVSAVDARAARGCLGTARCRVGRARARNRGRRRSRRPGHRARSRCASRDARPLRGTRRHAALPRRAAAPPGDVRRRTRVRRPHGARRSRARRAPGGAPRPTPSARREGNPPALGW